MEVLIDALATAKFSDAVLASPAIHHDPDILPGRILAPHRTPEVTDRRLSAACSGGPFPSYLRSLMGYDEPGTLSHAISSICPIGADGARGDEMRAFPHPRSREAVEALARWRGASAGLALAEAFAVVREVERR